MATTHINSAPLHKNTRLPLWHSLSPWMPSLYQQLQQDPSSQAGDQELSALDEADTTPSIYTWHFNIIDWALLTVSSFQPPYRGRGWQHIQAIPKWWNPGWSLHPALTPGSIWTFVFRTRPSLQSWCTLIPHFSCSAWGEILEKKKPVYTSEVKLLLQT